MEKKGNEGKERKEEGRKKEERTGNERQENERMEKKGRMERRGVINSSPEVKSSILHKLFFYHFSFNVSII